jgi:hypothetical protein
MGSRLWWWLSSGGVDRATHVASDTLKKDERGGGRPMRRKIHILARVSQVQERCEAMERETVVVVDGRQVVVVAQ